MKDIIEKWKPVQGYEGLYEVSDLGNVKSLVPWHGTNERLLSPGKTKGHLMVILSKNKEQKHHFVHRLVYEAFNGPIPEELQVNHINEVKSDNRLCNLNLMTNKENCNWGKKNEPLWKPVIAYDKKTGNFVKRFKSLTEAEKWLEKPGAHSGISGCLNGKQKSAYGYIWEYA